MLMPFASSTGSTGVRWRLVPGSTSYGLRSRTPFPITASIRCRCWTSSCSGADGGLLGSTGGRFFGWVVGGALPAAIAADWLASAWDQNGAIFATSPAAAVVEEVCGAWLKELFGLPPSASFALVTGCQMAHVTALAAARQRLLDDRGVDVQRHGLAGAPRLRVLASELRHETIDRAVRLLGIGTDAIVALPADDSRGISLPLLEQALDADANAPTRRLPAGRRAQHRGVRRVRRGLRARARERRMGARGRSVRSLGRRERSLPAPRGRRRAGRFLGDRRAQVAERALRRRLCLRRGSSLPPRLADRVGELLRPRRRRPRPGRLEPGVVAAGTGLRGLRGHSLARALGGSRARGALLPAREDRSSPRSAPCRRPRSSPSP